MDAAVSEASPANNYATGDLVVGKSSGQAWETFLQFDLSTVPANAELTTAELTLHSPTFGTGGPLQVSRPDAGWSEAGVTWTSRPAVKTLGEVALVVDDPTTARLSLPTAAVDYLQDIVHAAATNRGLKLSFPTATADQLFTLESREDTNLPQLVLTYTVGEALPDFTAGLGQDDGRLRAAIFEAPEGAPAPLELLWNTTPGVRYKLWESPDLEGWSVVPGYPVEADVLTGLHEIPDPATKQFFKVEALDEQPPEIVSRSPDDGAFGVKRYYPGDEVGIQLSDVSGVDPASLSLTLEGVDTFTEADAQLTFTDGLLTLDLGGDTAMGAYGAAINASLTVADTLGNSATYDWSFELEKEVVLADGLFTFGSPDAQRAGQRVPPIPTRILAERAGGGGPIRMNDAEWTLKQVNADSLVIAYTGASAPVFAIDQYLTNMTPATVDEIFYRKVTSINDDTGLKKLTLGTVDVPAYEVVVEGSFSLSEDDIAFEVDAEGRIIRAYGLSAVSASEKHTLEMRPLEINWSGKSIMGLFELYGETQASFGLPIPSKDPLGNDWEAKLNLKQAWLRLTPSVSMSADLGFFSVKRFWSKNTVEVDALLEPEFEFFAKALSYTWSAEDDITGEPLLKLNYTIPLGPTGLWVDVNPRLRAEASISAGLTGTVSAGASGGYSKTMTFDYVKGREPDALVISGGENDFYFDLIEPEVALGGTVGAEFKLIPEIDVKLVSLVGFYVNIDPTLGADLNADFSSGSLFSADVGLGFDGRLNAGLSVRGVDNGLLPSFEPWDLFSWEKRWYFPDSLADPLEILVQPKDQTVQPGDTISLNVQANHDSGVNYEWLHDGRPLFNNSATFRIYNASAAATGMFQVILSRAGSTDVTSDAALVIVQESTPDTRDSDGDGLADIYENNTGVYVGPTATGTSPTNWDSDEDGLGDGYELGVGRYFLIRRKAAWSSHVRMASNQGGHLATIVSSQEQEMVNWLLRDQNASWYSLGASRPTEVDNLAEDWSWITGEPFEYTNWGNLDGKSPDNREETAMVEFGGSGTWGDIPPDGRYGSPQAYLLEYGSFTDPNTPD